MSRRHAQGAGLRQLTIFDWNDGTVDASTGRSVTYPAGDFRPDLAHGLAWCPYCGRVTLFAWDARLKEPRCPGCSIGIGDYYVAQINKLSTDKACEIFAGGVRRAGLVFERPLFFEKESKKL